MRQIEMHVHAKDVHKNYHVDQHCHRQVNITKAVRLQKHGIHCTAALRDASKPPPDRLGGTVRCAMGCSLARAVVPPLSANFAKILELLRRRKIIIADLITRSLARPAHRCGSPIVCLDQHSMFCTIFSPFGFYVITSHLMPNGRSRQFGNCMRNKNQAPMLKFAVSLHAMLF
jgi:hypothetical protein